MKKILTLLLTVVIVFCSIVSTSVVYAAPKNTVKTSISSVESAAKGFDVSWKEKSKIKGYQIQYSTSSKFKKSSSQIKTVAKPKATSTAIRKLKGCNKKYYVRVRTYKISSGKRLYSSWSKAKSVTTLKHKYRSGTCKWCKKKAVPIDPNKFNPNRNYACVADKGLHKSKYSDETSHLFTISYLDSNYNCASIKGYVKCSKNKYKYWPRVDGQYYAPTAEWNCQSKGLAGKWSYKITNKNVVIKSTIDYKKKATIKCELLSDNSLKVVSVTGQPIPKEAGIVVGTIFYPNSR